MTHTNPQLHAITITAAKLLSPDKLAVIASVVTILMVFVAGSKLASNSDEKTLCVVSCVRTISAACGMAATLWAWGLIKSLLLDHDAIQVSYTLWASGLGCALQHEARGRVSLLQKLSGHGAVKAQMSKNTAGAVKEAFLSRAMWCPPPPWQPSV